MRRREFIRLIGGSVAVWPLAAQAQQSGAIRRIGILMAYAENDPEAQDLIESFQRALQELGWKDGANLQIEYRWAAGDKQRMQELARDIVGSFPIQSAMDLSVVSRDRPATSPVSSIMKRQWRANGSNCSKI
jgi:putative ABC transport system substrate-binding protein